MSIAENIKRVRGEIEDAAVLAGRHPGDITLVAAAKTNNAAAVRQAITAGVDAVGENRVQEMLEKNAQGAYEGAPLHFIGHLQSNKVKNVVGLCGLIESVGSFRLLELIGRRASELGIVQDVLIEVNIADEPSKSGITAREALQIPEIAPQISGVNVLGLMAIPPSDEPQRKYFDMMNKLFVDIRDNKCDNIRMRVLSMGMSGSFKDAICAGATMVRLGSAIFGTRMYHAINN